MGLSAETYLVIQLVAVLVHLALFAYRLRKDMALLRETEAENKRFHERAESVRQEIRALRRDAGLPPRLTIVEGPKR